MNSRLFDYTRRTCIYLVYAYLSLPNYSTMYYSTITTPVKED